MANLILNGSTSGSITISSPSVSGSNTLTLPANTGTVITTGSTFAGTGPAFSAYRSTNQTPATNTWTKIQLNVEEFDTNSNFDSTTNYRFTPTVAGYYEVSALIDVGGTGVSFVLGGIYKNGSLAKYIGGQTTTTEAYINGGYLFSMNGSTDYLELYVYITATTPTVYAGSTAVSFSGFLARSA